MPFNWITCTSHFFFYYFTQTTHTHTHTHRQHKKINIGKIFSSLETVGFFTFKIQFEKQMSANFFISKHNFSIMTQGIGHGRIFSVMTQDIGQARLFSSYAQAHSPALDN